MSRIVIWSDTHLGHKNIHKFRTQFNSADEHHEYIYGTLEDTINKRDALWLLGDVAFDEYWLRKVADLPCSSIHIVLGNHDTDSDRRKNISLFTELFSSVHGLVKKGPFWFSHAPIHPQELRGKINVHGHVHSNTVIHRNYKAMVDNGTIDREIVKDKRYVNACPEATGWKPIVYQELVRDLKKERLIT
jgi:calcineurin-like phosphoesterase family protein